MSEGWGGEGGDMRDDYDEIKQNKPVGEPFDGTKPDYGQSNYSEPTLPVTIEVNLKRFEDIKACLRECAEDLECELRDRYPDLSYPSEARRFARDMEPVERAYELLGGR